MIQQHYQGLFADHGQGDMYGGQGRRLHPGIRLVIEPNDRDVAWNLQPGLPDRAHGSNGGVVIACNHGGEFHARCQDRPHRLIAAPDCMPAMRDQSRIHL